MIGVKAEFKRAERFLKRVIWAFSKFIVQYFSFKRQNKIVFILGCQRSGTTLIADILDRDIYSRVFAEYSELSSDDHLYNIRLNHLSKVKKYLAQLRARLIVVRPLVESHRANELLDLSSDAKVLWIYRHYSDVVSSNLKKFGENNGYKNLAPILMRDNTNWRSEGLSKEIYDLVLFYSDKGLNPQEAQCLFWYVRNHWFFENNLQNHDRVLPVNYERFVISPQDYVNKIYDFVECNLPSKNLVFDVHAKSVNKPVEMDISDDILLLCNNMWKKLENLKFLQR